jgi:hypothetical protein
VFRKSLKAAVCVLAAGTALAACGPLKPGAAAIVGNDRITDAKLDSAVTQWSKELPKYPEAQQLVQKAQAEARAAAEGQPVPPSNPNDVKPFDPSSPQRSALFLLIAIRSWDELGREKGLTPSPGQVDAFLARLGGPAQLNASMVAQGLPTSYAGDFARTVMVQQALVTRYGGGTSDPQTEQAAEQRMVGDLVAVQHKLGITVNPRYGTFDADMHFGAICPRLSTPDSGTPDNAAGEVKCQV